MVYRKEILELLGNKCKELEKRIGRFFKLIMSTEEEPKKEKLDLGIRVVILTTQEYSIQSDPVQTNTNSCVPTVTSERNLTIRRI